MSKKRSPITKAELQGLAADIRRLRAERGLSQSTFAPIIGVRQQQLSNWENGQSLRHVAIAMRLARLLAKK